ncbi:putative glycolipid-binding domain-containing protein [Clostridium sp. UBA6640]|uniref:putative glycolipid-binding domain-containing protein n=1 Tax=Clostridium sp. UBA6640 TaxID=1946370 RepID=UPI0025BA3479|nr:putative glycolipid-binding domain-containing protein [Clostridium sp. UBA6640]
MKKELIWKALDGFSTEHLCLYENQDGIIANSVVIGMNESVPFRINYEINCDLNWKVNKVDLRVFDNKSKNITLLSGDNGIWRKSCGEEIEDLRGCIDIDISITPFTNTIPIRRLSLKLGEPSEIRVIYIDVHNFKLKPVTQRYTCLESILEGFKYKYENLGSGFVTEFFVDKEGSIIDYPDIFERVD